MRRKIDMAYRFVDSSKWVCDGWFIDLDPHQKLMFIYICDNCDIAGFFELSLKKMMFDLSMTADEVKASLKGLERCYILSIDLRVLFLKNFIKHQKNLPLNDNNKAHQGILKRFELYKEKFENDMLELTIQNSPKVKNKGLQSPTGNGIGNGIINFVDYKKGIEFENFWNLYGRKVGDKQSVEKKWNSLPVEIQNKTMAMLPVWKAQFTDKMYQPHPETFLNQQRWNDEVEIKSEPGAKSKHPSHYNAKYEASLSGEDLSAYWRYLRELGYAPKKDNQQRTIDWIKAS